MHRKIGKALALLLFLTSISHADEADIKAAAQMLENYRSYIADIEAAIASGNDQRLADVGSRYLEVGRQWIDPNRDRAELERRVSRRWEACSKMQAFALVPGAKNVMLYRKAKALIDQGKGLQFLRNFKHYQTFPESYEASKSQFAKLFGQCEEAIADYENEKTPGQEAEQAEELAAGDQRASPDIALPAQEADPGSRSGGSDWSRVDVRSLRVGMTFRQIQDLVGSEWKDAQLKKEMTQIAVAGEKKQFGRTIRSKAQGEALIENVFAQFIPPRTIKSGPDESIAWQVSVSAMVKGSKGGIKLSDLLARLIAKYGQPTSELRPKVNNASWAYSEEGKLWTDEALTEKVSEINKRCQNLQYRLSDALSLKQQGGDVSAINFDELQKSFLHCHAEADPFNQCRSNNSSACPFRVYAEWYPEAPSSELLRSYGISQYDYRLGRQQQEIENELRKQLEEEVGKRAIPSGDIKF